jgi:hypothetical protein
MASPLSGPILDPCLKIRRLQGCWGVHRLRRGGRKRTSPIPWTGAPCSPKRTWAEEDGAQPSPMLLLCGEKIWAKSNSSCAWSESIGRTRSRPMYAWANMGHPSRTVDRGWEIKLARGRRPIFGKSATARLAAASVITAVSREKPNFIQFYKKSRPRRAGLALPASLYQGTTFSRAVKIKQNWALAPA